MALQNFMDLASLQPQVDLLPPSKNPNPDPQKTPDTSFSDLVASYKEEERPSPEEKPSARAEEASVKSEDTAKTGALEKADEGLSDREELLKVEYTDFEDVKLSKPRTDGNQRVSGLKNDGKGDSKIRRGNQADGRPQKKAAAKKDDADFSGASPSKSSRLDELLQNADDFTQFVGIEASENQDERLAVETEPELGAVPSDAFYADEGLTRAQLEYLSDDDGADFAPETELFADKPYGREKKTFALDREGKISVEDLRTQSDFENYLKEDKAENTLRTELKIDSQNSATITMDYVPQEIQADILSSSNQAAGAQTSNFQAMLSNQLQANVPEFVRAGGIVLKDNNQGTINLVLHPDDLGNVRIQLSLDGKSVQGHIAVATKEALQVFRDNAETLREAFVKGGFDAASFDVSYQGGSGGSFEGQEFARNDGQDLWGRRTYSSGGVEAFDSMADDLVKIEADFAKNSVNIVA